MGKRRYDPRKTTRSFGLKVRSMRENRGWTLEECEERGWQSWTHLQRIESGKNITLHTLIKLANLFGVSPSDLLKDI